MQLTNESGMRVAAIPGKVLPNAPTVTVIVRGSWFLVPNAVEPVPEDDQPHLNADTLWDDDPRRGCRTPSDFAPYKPGADLLLAAHAHAPNNQPVRFLPVSFAVGSFRKSAMVVGDRWLRAGVLGNKLTDPEPFTKLPLDWSRSWGGPGQAANPVGRGSGENAVRDGVPVRMVANVLGVEGPGSDPLVNPRPVGFAPTLPDWEPRAGRVGRFDAAWLKEQWPWLPADIDWRYFSAAPPDQYLDRQYLRGDETLEFVNLHPDHPVLATRLAGRQPRAFIHIRRKGGEVFEEVLLRLDTLLADLDANQVHLTWRGVTAVETRKFKELEELIVFEEPLGAPIAATLEGYRAHAEALEAKKREKLKIPPIVFDHPVIPQLAPLSTAWADRLSKQAEAVKASAIDASADFPPVKGPTGAVLPKLAVPPPPPAPTTIKAAEAIMKADVEELAKLDARLPQAEPLPDLADFADEDEESPPEEPEAEDAEDGGGEWTRERVIARLETHGSLDEENLAGLDLSRLCFDGESLRGATLDDCDLSGSTFVRTDLSRASLRGARLAGATLESADLERADLTEVTADGVSLAGARLVGTDFSDAALAGCCLDDVEGAGAVFSSANLEGASFVRARLTGADFGKARLRQANFLEAALATADFDRADARNARFESVSAFNVRASRTNFDGATFRKCAADKGVFEESRFQGVDFREASLVRATLTGSRLGRAVFALADLRWARLDDVQAPGATFVGVNLFRGTLENAVLDDARLLNCNLYQVELEGTSFDKASLEDVNWKGTRRES